MDGREVLTLESREDNRMEKAGNGRMSRAIGSRPQLFHTPTVVAVIDSLAIRGEIMVQRAIQPADRGAIIAGVAATHVPTRTRFRRLFLLTWALFLSTGPVGCRQKAPSEEFWRERAVDQLRVSARNEDPRVRDRAQRALSELESGGRDRAPILVVAGLTSLESGEIMLCLSCFDSDRDLLGWRIHEERVTADGGKINLDEDYPVYAGSANTPLYSSRWYRVSVRTEGQQKDERAWQEYVSKVQSDATRRNSRGRADKTEASSDSTPDPEPPPVWISIPQANRVSVFISLYDRARHESERVEVIVPPSVLRDINSRVPAR
jgi:hypothetical protein